MRGSGTLRKFMMQHGAHFKFIDKNGDAILNEKEDDFALSNILSLCPDQAPWKELYIQKEE